MKHNLLITRPNFYVTTRYLFVWAKKIIELAEKSAAKFLILRNSAPTEKSLKAS